TVRERSLGVLRRADLARAGFVFEMVIQHEHQHNETMLQTLALAEPGVFKPPARTRPAGSRNGIPSDMARIDGGPFIAGAPEGRFTYDNERPRHEVDLPAFEIDRLPVTNGEFLDFVDAGGYARRFAWSEQGWAWRSEQGVERPLYWTADGRERNLDRLDDLDPSRPV